MQLKLELIPVPVADVDRSKVFYIEQAGFVLDVDVTPTDTLRVVQLTPPGSACSIMIGTGLQEISEIPPGSLKQLHLVVADLQEARDTLRSRDVEVSDIVDMGGGIRYAYFSDPDGNTWALQEMAWRTGANY
jgi:predicted enzyme related to lactoylglutathione lyase